MKKAEEYMEEFMRTWKNMIKYQNIDISRSNYDDIEKAFREEKNIVATYESNENEISQKQRRIEWEKGIKVEGLPILTMKEVDNELAKKNEQQKEQER